MEPHLKRFLITTALEETWVDDRPVLFLGEWCRLYARRSAWSGLDAEVVPHHWTDQGRFDADYAYLGALYERALEVVAERLNHAHDVQRSTRYWRILIGPWLAYFLQIAFDRWSSIQTAVTAYDVSGTLATTRPEASLTPNDMGEFVSLMVGDHWNHHLYTTILQQFTSVPLTVRSGAPIALVPEAPRRGLRHRLEEQYRRAIRPLVRERDAVIINSYLPLTHEARLQARLAQIPQVWRAVAPVRVAVDWPSRHWTLAAEARSDFERFAFGLLPRQLPAVYLEGYRQLRAQVAGLPWPARPKVIFTSNVLLHDTVAMAYTAEKVSDETRLVAGQCGGGYGVSRVIWNEEHEVAVSDRYLSWGWSVESQPKITPVGILKVQKHVRTSSNRRPTLLLVSLTAPRYTYRLTSETMALSDAYFERCFTFAATLPPSVRSHLLVRLNAQEYGWSERARWHDRLPEVALEPGAAKMRDLLADARIAVYTYNSTGFLEAFAGNVPAVLLFDPEVTPIRASALPYFDELKRAGIFHTRPESAARHVEALWPHVDAWWGSAAVQQALTRFKAQYCHVPPNLLDGVEAALRSTMDAGPRMSAS